MIYDKEKIKALRLAQGMSQAALAKKAGVSQPTVSAVEHGEEHVKAETLTKLARALGVNLQDIMKQRVTSKDREGQRDELMALFEALDDPSRSALVAAAKAFLGPKKK